MHGDLRGNRKGRGVGKVGERKGDLGRRGGGGNSGKWGSLGDKKGEMPGYGGENWIKGVAM